MEHPCNQCHASVTDSSAFCPSCGAPQVRFVHTERSAFPIAVTAGVAPPVARLETYSVQHPAAVANRRAVFRAALSAGVLAAVLSSHPVEAPPLFTLPLAGFLCVLLCRRGSIALNPTPRSGFRLGAWAGIAAFVVLIMLSAMQVLGFHEQNKLRDRLVQAVRQAQSRSADPQARQALEHFLTPGGLALLMILGSAFVCLLFIILSGIGGAISAALLRRKLPPQ